MKGPKIIVDLQKEGGSFNRLVGVGVLLFLIFIELILILIYARSGALLETIFKSLFFVIPSLLLLKFWGLVLNTPTKFLDQGILFQTTSGFKPRFFDYKDISSIKIERNFIMLVDTTGYQFSVEILARNGKTYRKRGEDILHSKFRPVLNRLKFLLGKKGFSYSENTTNQSYHVYGFYK